MSDEQVTQAQPVAFTPPSVEVDAYGTPLERIDLGKFATTSHNGARITPHKGQSIWTYGYGRTLADTQAVGQAMAEAETGTARAEELCAFVAGEVAKVDAFNPRGRVPLRCETAAEVMLWPDALLAWVGQKLLGMEAEGEGPSA